MTKVSTTASRQLDVRQFSRARSAELSALHRALTGRGGSRRSFQVLPKHLRRRSSSHNIYRIPVRLRAQAQKEMDAAPPAHQKVARRHRRRKKVLQQVCEKRQGSNEWLCTHIWLTKRMRMSKLWGFQIPLTANDKGQRAAYNSTANRATIQDTSYFGCLQVSGPDQATVLAFMSSLVRAPATSLRLEPCLSGRRWGMIEFVDLDGNLIVPSEFLWTSCSTLLVMVHPAAWTQVWERAVASSRGQLGIEVKSLRQYLAMFDLIGPLSHRVLSQVFKFVRGHPLASVEVVSGSSHSPSPARLPPKSVVATSVQVNTNSFRYTHGDKTNKDSSPTAIPVHIDESTGIPAQAETLSSFIRSCETFLPPPQAMTCPTNEKGAGLLVPWVGAVEDRTDALIPVVLLQQPSPVSSSHSFGSGWRLILPRRAPLVRDLFERIVHAGARVIGIQDYEKVRCEAGVPSFPRDYPHTQAGQDYIAREYEELCDKNIKRPLAKRRLVNTLPTFDQGIVPSVSVLVTAIGKGTFALYDPIMVDGKPIGFVTSCKVSFLRGRAVAVGAVLQQFAQGHRKRSVKVGQRSELPAIMQILSLCV